MMADFLDELRWSLQALAQSAEVQLELYPNGAAKADELALDFEHWRLCALGQHGSSMTTEQQSALNNLDQFLEALSGPDNSRHWTVEALRSDPSWATVRELALQALNAFGWLNERPPAR